MPKLRAHNISISLDGYLAGPDQGRHAPLGIGGERLHEWAFATRTFRLMHGASGGEGGSVDDEFAAAGSTGIGATIMGRNMFGPVRGPWPDESWTGWWGDDPPFHHPVFVLTHHPRRPLTMAGGTTFYFETEGIHAALKHATEAAGGADIRLGGGAATIQAYLREGLLDQLHLVIVPVLLGGGERLFEPLGGAAHGYTCAGVVTSPAVTHVRLVRT